MEQFILTVLKDGSMAFIGCKITKALRQEEISDLIRAGGWATIGISGVAALIPVIKGVKGTFEMIGDVGAKLAWVGEFAKWAHDIF